MYRHYCKDPHCPGHTKNWERCCDMRAFSTQNTDRTKPLKRTIRFKYPSTPATMNKNLVLA
jgi:hypothetical protein